MGIRVRDFKSTDSASLAEIFHDAVHIVGREYYTPSQINAWSPAPVSSDKFLMRVSDGRSVFVAVDCKDNPLGFIELEEDGHIDCFYCHPKFVRTGVGFALYSQLEKAALEAGLTRLYVEASEVAQSFFIKEGFTLIKRQDFEHNGVDIYNHLMEKDLH